ncbi:MAG TPA: hypothetical protein PK079_12595 [Leptospiraceae bacterium]|nr:hypothetical protein [Leptospiraceae bacterium]HMW06913.1 hypothetical protein [Leptospiraceae bacterium]HMX32275.1 hypothetical protein [Leptospiraceae bacterium]HMY33443.1 hypothetical protein [Leptospiraceae bacterium]HMZ65477.1 hypothetical protein [Leptospiraceae bacterium]
MEKTKLQILKESTVYVLLLGFISSILFKLLELFISEEEMLLSNIFLIFIFGFLSFVLTALLMGYFFEKDKPIWIGFLKYSIIGICSTVLTVLVTLILLPFVFDFMVEQVSFFWKDAFQRNIIVGLIMIIPMFIIGIFLAFFGIFAFLFVSYFLGNWIFSFLVQWLFVKYSSKDQKDTKLDSNLTPPS